MHINRNKKLSKFDKRIREDEARDRVRLIGGTILSFNWKRNKKKAHFLTANGQKGITNLV